MSITENLNALYRVTEISTYNFLLNDVLKDLSGLSNVSTISGSLKIKKHSNITTKLKKTSAFCLNYDSSKVLRYGGVGILPVPIPYEELCVDDNGVTTPLPNEPIPDPVPDPDPEPIPEPIKKTWNDVFSVENDYTEALDTYGNDITYLDGSEFENADVIDIFFEDFDFNVPEEAWNSTTFNGYIFVQNTGHIDFLSKARYIEEVSIGNGINDISGLANVTASAGIVVYTASNITKKVNASSDFCQYLFANGVESDIEVVDSEYDYLDYSDVCEAQ